MRRDTYIKLSEQPAWRRTFSDVMFCGGKEALIAVGCIAGAIGLASLESHFNFIGGEKNKPDNGAEVSHIADNGGSTSPLPSPDQ